LDEQNCHKKKNMRKFSNRGERKKDRAQFDVAKALHQWRFDPGPIKLWMGAGAEAEKLNCGDVMVLVSFRLPFTLSSFESHFSPFREQSSEQLDFTSLLSYYFSFFSSFIRKRRSYRRYSGIDLF
jgi:hypothetical protein